MSPATRKIQGCARSLVWTFAALLTASPAAWAGVTVSLTAPANGTSYVPPVNIPLSASASASGGYTVSKVEFFYGTTLIGTDTSSPYSIAWNNAPSGQHVLTAKATAIKKNSPDQTATSSAVNVTVNAPPVVTITSPAGLTSYTIPPPNITVTASASDSDGTITKVEFLDCGLTTVLATVTTPPYNFVWNLPPPYWEVWADGTVLYSAYAIIARATDNLGGVALSGEFCTTAYVTPTVTLTAPANGASFNAPATVNLTAALGPSDGPIRKMQFYNGTTLLGEATTAPYTFTWQNVQAGTYSLSARSIWGKEENPQEVSSPVNIINVTAAQAQLHYIHVDHLNTPRLVANAAGQAVWRWDQQEPFGNNPADENPSGLGTFDLPLRLPGQHFDKETNLHYNYFRDYDPSIGRYEQSDPIGIRGGLNTYAYGLASPLLNTDPRGLDVYICTRPVDVSWIPNWVAVYLPPHTWIKTDTYESGMGGECPVPGQQCSDRPYSATSTKSHAGQSMQPNSTCMRLQNVSEECVNNLIKPGSPTGTWTAYNQCQSFAWSVTAQCRYGPQIGPILPDTLQQRGPLGSRYGP